MIREEEIIKASQECIYTLSATLRSCFRDGARWADKHPKNPFNDISEGILPKEDLQNPSYSIPVLVKEENGYLHTDRYKFNIDAWEEAVSEVVAWAEIPQSWI